jgi:hypothetical protein
MTKTAQLITTERRHLLDVFSAMARAVDPALLADPRKPLTAKIMGSNESGKKIIPDVFRETVQDNPSLTGLHDFDELWNDGRIETAFINMGWLPNEYSTLYGENESDILRNFNAQRMLGGVTFIHNIDDKTFYGDLDIYLESHHNPPFMYSPAQYETCPFALREKFYELSRNAVIGSWIRFITIHVNNEQLLQTQPFANFMESLIPETIPGQHRALPVYGVTLPVPVVTL